MTPRTIGPAHAKETVVTKEEVYDEQISEMMTKIIQICHDNKIAMIADFALDEDLKCLTVLLSEAYDPPDSMVEAARILKNGVAAHIRVL